MLGSLWVCVNILNGRWTSALILLINIFCGRECVFSCVGVCLWLFYQLASWDEAAVFRSSYLDASPSVVEQCWEIERGGWEMGGLAVLVSSLLPSGLSETYRTLSKGINSNNKKPFTALSQSNHPYCPFFKETILWNQAWNGIRPLNITHISAV